VRSPVRSRLVVGSVYGVITVALVAGTTAFVSLDKNVTISVDGQLTKVRTYAASVDGVLHRAGIGVGPHDSLTPAPSAKVHDGTTITIARGRLLRLTIDGVTHQAWVTGDNVDEVLQQAGLRIPQAADVSVDRGARVPLTGMTISINLPHLVNVRVDGTVHSIVSTQTTLQGVLAQAGIHVNPADQVSTDLNTRPYDGLYVIIVRIGSSQAETSSPIPFTTKTQNDPTILVGTKKVEQVGEVGTMVATYEVGYADGVQTTKSLVAQQVTVPAVAQIIGVGTKPKPKPKPKPVIVYKIAVDGLNWKALSDCEAGGRASAYDPPYYGMYQFRANTWHAVGGTELPSQASANEQTYRAQLLYKRSNWRTQWPVCGHYLFT
jgi:resuscitation-promoting factor RpfB